MSIQNRRQGVPAAARTSGASAPVPPAVESPTIEATAEVAEAVSPGEVERVFEAPMATIMAAPLNTMAKPQRFRIHSHGGLRHDGMFFAPGEELPMSEDEIKLYGITCVEPIPEG